MAILLFIIAGATGLGLTTYTLRYAMRYHPLTYHGHALILAIGFGVTWIAAFLAPLIAPGNRIQLKASLFLFFIGHSILVAITTYLIVRVWFMIRPKHQK
jgi:hypothetical protein